MNLVGEKNLCCFSSWLKKKVLKFLFFNRATNDNSNNDKLIKIRFDPGTMMMVINLICKNENFFKSI